MSTMKNRKNTLALVLAATIALPAMTVAKDYSRESLSEEEKKAISVMPEEFRQMLEHVQPEADQSVITLPWPESARLETHLTKAPVFFGENALPAAIYQSGQPFEQLVQWYRDQLPSRFTELKTGEGEVLFVDKAAAKGRNIASIQATKEILSIPHVRLEPPASSEDDLMFRNKGETEIKLIYKPAE